jgi:cyclopropane fatty-acyl-phospholipid synthase-like methyltransferase
MTLLDVGCGWGSLIVHAARNFGVTAIGITLSEQQAGFITERMASQGLQQHVSIRRCDYRDLPGLPQFDASFDAVASIEMGEHVGEGQYPRYADIVRAALKPQGLLLLQQMSRRVRTPPGGGPFIETYIAPDIHMRPLPRTLEHLENVGFDIRDVEAMREHYTRTVDCWIQTFEDRYDEFVALLGEQVGCGGCIWWADASPSRRAGWEWIKSLRCGPTPQEFEPSHRSAVADEGQKLDRALLQELLVAYGPCGQQRFLLCGSEITGRGPLQ